jgi:hypothetical protein
MYQVEQPPGRLPDISALVRCFPGRWKHLSRIYPVAALTESFVPKNASRKGLTKFIENEISFSSQNGKIIAELKN